MVIYTVHTLTLYIYMPAPIHSTIRSMLARQSTRGGLRFLPETLPISIPLTKSNTRTSVSMTLIRLCPDMVIILVGMNKFMDLSFDEFQAIYLSAPQVLVVSPIT